MGEASAGFEAGDDGRGDAIATRAEEGIGQCGRERVLQRRAQLAARAMQPGLHGLGAQAEAFGGFLDRAFLDFAHQEHQAVVLGQVVDRAFEQPADLAPRRAGRGILAAEAAGEASTRPASPCAASICSTSTVGRRARRRRALRSARSG